MVEGGKIDYAGHANDAATAFAEIEDFDNAIRVAYEFYEQHPDETLIVVTADHETGAITLNDKGEYEFTSDDHSEADVPLRVYGSERLIKNNETVNNYEIPIRIAYVLGFTEEQFPVSVMA